MYASGFDLWPESTQLSSHNTFMYLSTHSDPVTNAFSITAFGIFILPLTWTQIESHSLEVESVRPENCLHGCMQLLTLEPTSPISYTDFTVMC
ncbi:hypothetical protein QCA50_008271 [Cerrena zonata]|uniref:Uncharacterized protein n=1 Tax=Cerrena zonata TaxID=2478898 RepID=A0AAW0G8I2_9APHY